MFGSYLVTATLLHGHLGSQCQELHPKEARISSIGTHRLKHQHTSKALTLS